MNYLNSKKLKVQKIFEQFKIFWCKKLTLSYKKGFIEAIKANKINDANMILLDIIVIFYNKYDICWEDQYIYSWHGKEFLELVSKSLKCQK